MTSNERHRGTPFPVMIRSFQRSDQSECVKIFSDGFDEFFKGVILGALTTMSRYSVIAIVFASTGAMLWSTWILAVGAAVVVSLLGYPFIKLYRLGMFAKKKQTLETEFKDLEKSYMSKEGCHMWVADWNGKVVGMVGLMQQVSHEPGVARLQRMYVVSSCRVMGIGKKLLNELISYAKKQGIEKIELTTTSTQVAAIGLYKKHGFKLVKEMKIMGDTKLQTFYTQL